MKSKSKSETERTTAAEEHRPERAGAKGAPGDAAEAGAETAPAGPSPAGDADERARAYEDRWMRAEAELANFRRRALRDRQEAEARARERVLAEVLALADDLERALDAAEREKRSGPILQGVQLVHERVRDILRRHGVEVVDPVGRPFDPHVAEALMELERDDVDPGTVVQVIEKGYRQGERLLRPAKVAVARPPAAATPGESS